MTMVLLSDAGLPQLLILEAAAMTAAMLPAFGRVFAPGQPRMPALAGESPLVRPPPSDQTPAMSEIAKFVHSGAAKITPQVLHGVHKKLPLLKVEFATIHAHQFPHLVDQLEFLADVVEDFAEGEGNDLPFVAVANATFALIYAHRQLDLIPDSVPEFGRADDSGVVRTVLVEHEKAFAAYAAKRGVKWSKITLQP
jgi:uncharacterized membrane protein YkvA (DUF1232 family)